jgi:hypothetical protein
MLMSKLKLIVTILLLIGATGLGTYILWLKSENKTLTANATLADATIESLELEKAVRQADADTKQAQLRKRIDQIADLTRANAQLNKELNNAIVNDPIVVNCLAVSPGADYVNKLREYTQGPHGHQHREVVPRTDVLREADS